MHIDPALARRGILLLGGGYLLNLVRGTMFEIIDHLILRSLPGRDPGPLFTWAELLNVDILHFAGLAFLFFALCSRFRIPDPLMALFGPILMGVGTLLYEGLHLTAPTEIPQYLLGLFCYQNELTCFPFTLWIIFPLAGLMFGALLARVRDKKGSVLL